MLWPFGGGVGRKDQYDALFVFLPVILCGLLPKATDNKAVCGKYRERTGGTIN